MSINITLFGQMITFAIFVWFTMKFVWPPITKAMEERQNKIADGLAAGERGKQALAMAEAKIAAQLKETKQQANHIIDEANKRANQIIDDAKDKAKAEGKKLITHAQLEIDKHTEQARQALRKQVVSLAISSAEKILEQQIDTKTQNLLIDKLATQVN